ncbi:unnamed protein product [Leuciscus chuanchicus]
MSHIFHPHSLGREHPPTTPVKLIKHRYTTGVRRANCSAYLHGCRELSDREDPCVSSPGHPPIKQISPLSAPSIHQCQRAGRAPNSQLLCGALDFNCTQASLSLPSADQRSIRKLQIRAWKWKPTGIKPYVVTTLYGMAERDLPARALLQQTGNPNI